MKIHQVHIEYIKVVKYDIRFRKSPSVLLSNSEKNNFSVIFSLILLDSRKQCLQFDSNKINWRFHGYLPILLIEELILIRASINKTE